MGTEGRPLRNQITSQVGTAGSSLDSIKGKPCEKYRLLSLLFSGLFLLETASSGGRGP